MVWFTCMPPCCDWCSKGCEVNHESQHSCHKWIPNLDRPLKQSSSNQENKNYIWERNWVTLLSLINFDSEPCFMFSVLGADLGVPAVTSTKRANVINGTGRSAKLKSNGKSKKNQKREWSDWKIEVYANVFTHNQIITWVFGKLCCL